MTDEARPAATRRRLAFRVVWLVVLGALLAWRFWPRPDPVEAPPAPGWPSPLDVLDPARLADGAWPRDGRPAEAVGVLERDRDAEGRLEVSIDWGGVVLIKDARGAEMVRIDAYALPKPAGGGALFDPRSGQAIALNLPKSETFREGRDDHTVRGATLSPKADRLVVLGHTKHTASSLERVMDPDADWSGEWAQVWRWEGGTLTPLEAQPLENAGARIAAFSPDGKLLATGGVTRTDVWEVGEKELKHRGTISGERKQLLFAPDGRSLAVISTGSVSVYDLGPVLPGGVWTRWRLLWVALGLLAAVALFLLVSQPSGINSPAPPPQHEYGGVMVDQRTGQVLAFHPPGRDRGAAPDEHTAGVAARSLGAARARRRLSIAVEAAFLGVGACVAWWAWRPVPAGLPLNVGLGFGAALVVLLLLARARGRSPGAGGKQGFGVANAILLVAILGAVVSLGSWAWLFWRPSPSLLTPSDSDLASADVRSACFSADGRELAAVCFNGRLSLFDAATGKETQGWRMPAGVLRPEYAGDGRHLLAVAGGKAYVLRLKPFDDTAYVLSCCEKVLEQDPKSINALLARGHVRLHRGDLDEAIADFTEVIARDEKNAAAYHGRGLARTDRGDYAGARADFAAALRLDPKLAAAVSRRPPP